MTRSDPATRDRATDVAVDDRTSHVVIAGELDRLGDSYRRVDAVAAFMARVVLGDHELALDLVSVLAALERVLVDIGRSRAELESIS